MDFLQAGKVKIEYEIRGSGEPVLLIHPALIANALSSPFFAQPGLLDRYQLIHYHRRGYFGSTPGPEPPTYVNQAGDAATLLRHLGVRSSHIVGHSIGALIALQLAVDAPELVASLALLEPPLFMVPGGKENFEHSIIPLLKAIHEGNAQLAIDTFNERSYGPGWQELIKKAVPGGIELEMQNLSMFTREMAYLSEWKFDSQMASQIVQPVLSVVGTLSNPFMREGRALLHSWMPQTENFDPHTTHLLQMQDPVGVVNGLWHFFARHPIKVAVATNMR